jgi:hypothetical protein
MEKFTPGSGCQPDKILLASSSVFHKNKITHAQQMLQYFYKFSGAYPSVMGGIQ